MALVQTLTTSFKQQLFLGVHDLETDVIKMSLYTGLATLDADTTVYTDSYEVTGTGYTAGGNTLTGVTVSAASNGVIYVDFADSEWNPAAFTARGALIYNSSKGNKSIAVLDFGADKTCTNTFTVQMPANTATSALIRLT
jgi:hypothetical protein